MRKEMNSFRDKIDQEKVKLIFNDISISLKIIPKWMLPFGDTEEEYTAQTE